MALLCEPQQGPPGGPETKALYLEERARRRPEPLGLRGDWQSRRAVIAAGLRELAPDLVAFVEAIKTSEYDQAADLLGSEYHLFHAATRHDNGDGAVIATRWPLGERHEVDPAEPSTLSSAVPNCGPGVTIHFGQKTMRVVAVRGVDADEPPGVVVQEDPLGTPRGRGVGCLRLPYVFRGSLS